VRAREDAGPRAAILHRMLREDLSDKVILRRNWKEMRE
jgi:hypothetical protein